MVLGLAARRRRPRGRPFLARLSFVLGMLSLASLAACAAEPTEARPTVAALRPDTPDTTELPPRYDATDVVESIVSPAGSFRVHFTRAGRHAVPLADADADGTPDHVALVAATYDAVLARYVEMGFRTPRSDEAVPDENGGDGLFDVYLVDFGGGSDGAFRRELCSPDGCTGYMIQENDFAGSGYPSVSYGVRLLASHELFHAVQAAYDDGLGVQGSVLSEGTAVWASERFDPTLSDVERLAYGYTSRTDRSLGVDPATAGGAYTYGAGIFFEHLGVQFGDAIVRELWEDLAVADADAAWLEVLDQRLRASHGSSFEASFLALAEWMVFLGARADAAHGPVNGREYEPVAATLVETPFVDTSVRMFPASIRYFVAQRGALTVALGGAQAAEIDVLAVAFDGTRFVATERARGGVTIDAPGADFTFVALVDGRTTGSSRVVSLCIAEDATDCAAEADAGALADAGVGDGGLGGDDAGTIPPPASGCACRTTRGPQRAAPALVALAALAALAGRRRRRG
jgi:MYXO-CTERM domain-containing protein